MAKRYGIVSKKTDGDEAILSPETLRQLGLSNGDQITVTSSTAFYVLPVKADGVTNNLSSDHIQMPHKCSSVKEGERLSIEPYIPAKIPTGGQVNGQSTEVEWDPIADTSFEEIVGMECLKERIEEALYGLTHPETFLIRKTFPPRVFLLFGPYGCGKTMLAKAMASHLAQADVQGDSLDIKVKFLKATDVKDPYLGMSARNVQRYLDAARAESDAGATVLLVLDEIDSLLSSRNGGQTHEEYRDIVNIFLQDIQGGRELEGEIRIRHLLKDPEVQTLRKEVANLVRKQGVRNHRGDIMLDDQDWTPAIKDRMLRLRAKINDAGGVATVIIVGTTNDPCAIDEGFVSRAGDNIFFVQRPPAEAVKQMLAQQLDSAFVELHQDELAELATEAFQKNLTGRDIMLSWLRPIQSMTPGSLTITGYQTIRDKMPEPTVGISWEIELLERLKQRGQTPLASQISHYVNSVQAGQERTVPN